MTVAHKYADRADLWIVFDHYGANRLYSFAQWRIAVNEGERVDPDLYRPSDVLQDAISDWIGPYIVMANEQGTGNDAQHFTGGVHAYEGNDKGSATARTVSSRVWADGRELKEDGQIESDDSVSIQVINRIQGSNTKRADGSGREILQETVHYTIAGGHVQVSVETEALEDVTISRYYGLQTVNMAWNDKIRYYAGDDIAAIHPVKSYSDSGLLSQSPNVDRFLLNSGDERHLLYVWLDRSYGLGTMENVAKHRPAAFTFEYGKSYFLQIMDTELVVPKGKTVSWRGGYHFYSNDCFTE